MMGKKVSDWADVSCLLSSSQREENSGRICISLADNGVASRSSQVSMGLSWLILRRSGVWFLFREQVERVSNPPLSKEGTSSQACWVSVDRQVRESSWSPNASRSVMPYVLEMN